VRWLISVLILASQHASRRERTFMKMKNFNLRGKTGSEFQNRCGKCGKSSKVQTKISELNGTEPLFS